MAILTAAPAERPLGTVGADNMARPVRKMFFGLIVWAMVLENAAHSSGASIWTCVRNRTIDSVLGELLVVCQPIPNFRVSKSEVGKQADPRRFS